MHRRTASRFSLFAVGSRPGGAAAADAKLGDETLRKGDSGADVRSFSGR